MSYLTQKQAVQRVQAQIKKNLLPLNPELVSVVETLDRMGKVDAIFKAIYQTAKDEREICVHCNSIANIIEDAGLA